MKLTQITTFTVCFVWCVFTLKICVKKARQLPEHRGMLLWQVIDRLDAKEEDNNIIKVTHRWRSEGNS